MTKSKIIDMLRSLSIIEGAVSASCNREVQTVVMDEPEWCVSVLIKGMKDDKNE